MRILIVALLASMLLSAPVAAAPSAKCVVAGKVKVNVDLKVADSPKASAITVLLVYPPTLALPGVDAETSVKQRVRSLLGNATVAVNDTDKGLRIVLARAAGIPTGAAVAVEFDKCSGSAKLAAATFECVVEAAGNAAGNVEGASCSARIAP